MRDWKQGAKRDREIEAARVASGRPFVEQQAAAEE